MASIVQDKLFVNFTKTCHSPFDLSCKLARERPTFKFKYKKEVHKLFINAFDCIRYAYDMNRNDEYFFIIKSLKYIALKTL